MSYPLWEHQKRAIQLAEVMPDLGLFYEMGTGKTRTIVEVIRRRFAAQMRIRKTIIFAPIIVCQNWKDEFAKFSKINSKDIVVLTKTGKQRVKDFLNSVGDDLSTAKIIITNYESTQMTELYKLIYLWRPEILVLDESQKCKNPSSKRAKAIQALADLATHRYILTGTPILNSPMDIFMQFRILDAGQTFGKNFYAFRATYFRDANERWKGKQAYFPRWEPIVEKLSDMQERISRKALRVLKKDCLDLPPLIRQIIPIELSKEQARMYQEMREDYLAFIKQHTGEPRAVVAQLAITKALRLQQIVSGFAKDDKGEIHRLECPRLAVLKELLETITPTSKVIVWSVFKENYEMIAEVCKELGIEYREIHGDIPNKERLEGMDDFRTKPEVKVMIANQAAGGSGINLVEASYSVYYSKSFRLEDDLQSEARNHRGGSEMHEKITRIDLVAPQTIDELVNEALKNKQNISDKILSWDL